MFNGPMKHYCRYLQISQRLFVLMLISQSIIFQSIRDFSWIEQQMLKHLAQGHNTRSQIEHPTIECILFLKEQGPF